MDEKETVTVGITAVKNVGVIGAWLGLFCTWYSMAFRSGKRIGTIEAKLTSREDENEKAVIRIDKLEGLFTDKDGNERLLSVASYRESREECRDGFSKEIKELKDEVKGLRHDMREDINGLYDRLHDSFKEHAAVGAKGGG